MRQQGARAAHGRDPPGANRAFSPRPFPQDPAFFHSGEVGPHQAVGIGRAAKREQRMAESEQEIERMQRKRRTPLSSPPVRHATRGLAGGAEALGELVGG